MITSRKVRVRLKIKGTEVGLELLEPFQIPGRHGCQWCVPFSFRPEDHGLELDVVVQIYPLADEAKVPPMTEGQANQALDLLIAARAERTRRSRRC